MGISYRIDENLGLVFSTASGILSDEDLINHKRKLFSDPAFKPGMKELSDGSNIEKLSVTTDGVRKMAELDKRHAEKLRGYKLAILAHTDEVFGVARMYQAMTEEHFEFVQVFRDRAEAMKWLGLERTSR